MKFRYRSAISAVLFASVTLLSNVCYSQTWVGTELDNIVNTREWLINNNWSTAAAPTSAQTASFGATPAANTTVTFFNAGAVANSINITGAATSHNFGSTTNFFGGGQDPGSVLLGDAGAAASITKASATNQTFVSRVNFNAASATRTISNSGAGDLTFQSTAAVNASTGSLAINNTGTGVITFNGGVTAGTVTVGGTGQVRMASTVNSGIASAGRLDGTGTITGALTLNSGAIYSPGAGAVGTQIIGTAAAVTTAMNVNAGSTFEFDINGAASDVINLSGKNLNLAATAAQITMRLNLLSAINASVEAPQSWNVFTNVGNAGAIDLSLLQVDSLTGNTSGSSNSPFQFTWSAVGNNLVITAVPEPSSMALLGIAGLVGGVYARRRRMKK